MPKPKQFLKQTKKSKHAAQVPTTADEYLAAGVDFEEAGEKWRGGDAAKSARFFIRAIDCYEEALKKFPDSFDLAYNKARVQYELTQYPKLLKQLPGTLLELLKTALESSRYALKLNPENVDVLFNTGQVLRSLYECLEEKSDNASNSSVQFLNEALLMFEACLMSQQKDMSAFQEQQRVMAEQNQDMEMDDEDGGVSTGETSNGNGEGSSEQVEQWASVIEPVTSDSLIDTLLAQYETLTTISQKLSSDYESSVQHIIEYNNTKLRPKLEQYTAYPDREIEVRTTEANFYSALLDAEFRGNLISPENYGQSLTPIWTTTDFSESAKALCDAAESYVAFSTSVSAFIPANTPTIQSLLLARWNALSRSDKLLSEAAKLPESSEFAVDKDALYLTRGDVEMLRYQLGKQGLETARTSGSVLLNNAEKYYRGAGKLAGGKGEDGEGVTTEAAVKERLCLALRSSGSLEDGVKEGRFAAGDVMTVLATAVGEGLLTEEQVERLDIRL